MARAAAARTTTRSRTAPARPRRVSGPAAPPKKGRSAKATGRAAPQPSRRPSPKQARPNAGLVAAGGAIALRPLQALVAVPVRLVQPGGGGQLLDRLLRGRGWVALIGVLLAGIVFLNVTLLELNSGITRTNDRAGALKRENAGLRQKVARLGSTERIQQLAAEQGMFLPAPGDVRYVRADPNADARRALKRLSAPAAGEPVAGPEGSPANEPAEAAPDPVAAAPPAAEAAPTEAPAPVAAAPAQPQAPAATTTPPTG